MDNFIKQMCKGQPEEIQKKIKGAYWYGLGEGIEFANSIDSKIERIEDNVVFLANHGK